MCAESQDNRGTIASVREAIKWASVTAEARIKNTKRHHETHFCKDRQGVSWKDYIFFHSVRLTQAARLKEGDTKSSSLFPWNFQLWSCVIIALPLKNPLLKSDIFFPSAHFPVIGDAECRHHLGCYNRSCYLMPATAAAPAAASCLPSISI